MLDYSIKYYTSQLNLMEPIDVYKIILFEKHNKVFPKGFWEGEDGKEKDITIIKWLLDDHLNLTIEELLEVVS